MSELKKHITLPKNIDTGDDLDFSFLRKKGQEYIEQLAGNVWTDYNSHDPGITMLEMLCYAITDLGTRLQMPVENILSPENDSSAKIEDQFFKASQILPSKPVTVNDYRKLFIDIDGVKNCWLKPYEKTVWVDCKNGQLSYNSADFEEGNSENGIMAFFENIIFELKKQKGESLIIERPEKFGGNLEFNSYDELKNAVIGKKIHPLDVKMGCAVEITNLLSKVEENRKELEEISERAYPK